MHLKIKSIIIWPKNKGKEIRKIDFEANKINIITGGSEKGKSALISIVDYCLGSSKCKIPTRKIRDYSEWFGVLFSLNESSELLLARKEPKDEIASGEMFMKIATQIELPLTLESNYNVSDIKNNLDNIAKLSDLRVSGDQDKTGFDSRPAFRDLTSFLFQPQYIIANQSTLFYRADSMAHREKLKNIFPYIYQAVDNRYLELKDELKEVERKLGFYEKELERKTKYITKWLGQLRGYYFKAKEFGLLKDHPYPSDSWHNDEFLPLLREISIEVTNNIIPSVKIDNITATSNRISELTTKEIDIAYKIHGQKHRQELIKKINDSNRIYRNSLLNQENRLRMSTWIQDLLKKDDEKCPFCGKKSIEAKSYVSKLIETKNEIIDKGIRLNDNYSVLSGEYKKVTKDIEDLTVDLNNIRKELETLRNTSNSETKHLNTLNSIYQFAGKIEAELGNYDSINDDKELLKQIKDLKARKVEIEKEINDNIIKGKIERAKRKIADGIKFYAEIFKAENWNEIIEFNEKDLTVNFISQSGRRDALYEIGSGHNFMAYHISTLLSLHEFFISQKNHPVPNFIIIDQPTQVYFPESSDSENTDKSDDLIRVKRIFEALQKAIERTKGNLQIIVLEHVGKYAWEGLNDVVQIKRWRNEESDNALIPEEWLI